MNTTETLSCEVRSTVGNASDLMHEICFTLSNNASIRITLEGGKAEHVERLEQAEPQLRRLICSVLDPDNHSQPEVAPQPPNGGAMASSDPTEGGLPLSETESAVFELLKERLTEREVAAKLNRSPHTIHVHVKNIYRKMRVSSREELLQLEEPATNGNSHPDYASNN